MKLNQQQSKENISNKFNSDINNINTKIFANNGEIKALKAEIERLNNISDICPTCGQKIPGVYKPDTSSQEISLNELTTKNQELELKLKEIEHKKQLELENINLILNSELNKYSEQSIKLNEELNSSKELISELSENKNIIEKKLLQAQSDKKNFENNKKDLEEKIKNLESQLADLNEKMLYNTKERDEFQNRLDVNSKMLNIAKRDFRGYLLSNIIEFINYKAKSYCKDIFNTDKIDFILDKNNILISYDNKPYENLSGGEKQKIDIIIQFSIRDMLCQFLNFSSNILVLDEVFDNIDSIGCEKIINLISTKLNDIESIFIITHHTDIPISADSIISIIKNEKGISNLQ